MKLLVLVLGFFLVAMLSWADVVGEVISIDKDDNGNIRVWTQYKIDGVEVDSRYPKINGKEVYCSRYNAINFVGMTDLQIKERIMKDVDDHTKSLIRNTYIPKANDDIFANHLKTVVGEKKLNTSVTIQVDTDGDGVKDKDVEIKTDGSSIISPVSP
jgi:hypothetical protein